MARLKKIVNPKSKARGLLVEVIDQRWEGPHNHRQLFLKVRKGDGRVFWTKSYNVGD